MNILLTGATGFIGHRLLCALLDQGHRITACCRHPEKLLIHNPNIKPLSMDFTTASSIEKWLPQLKGIDAIVNCVGIIEESKGLSFSSLHTHAPTALFQAGAESGVKKIVQISALGADGNAESAYHLSKKAADDVLRSLPVAWYVLQPSLVYGDGGQSCALLQALSALPVHLQVDGGRQLLQPIHVDDVAAAVCCCLDPASAAQKTVALVGPEPIAYGDLLSGLRRRLRKPPAATYALPYAYAQFASRLGKWLGEPILSKDNLAMLRRGNSADPQAITALLGRPPLSVTARLLEKPTSQAERWHADLYFIRPLLRFAIALVWLWSGITSLLFYPHQASYELLAETGVTGSAAPLTLYGLALVDIGLGLATLRSYHPDKLMLWQIMIVAGYSLALSWKLPEFWLHPFGPLLKNIPFLLCLLIYRHLQGEKP